MSSQIPDKLLYPELIRQMPLTGGVAEHMLRARVQEGLVDELTYAPSGEPHAPNISFVVRTLNENMRLESLLRDVGAQEDIGEIEIIVVDNESSDTTQDVARRHGAEVVRLARGEFTYSRAMNLGVEVASHELVFLTVGHANLSNRYQMQLSARHFNRNDTGGVFARCLFGFGASKTERVVHAAGLGFLRKAHQVKKAGMGVLGATNCMISREAWSELGKFDEDIQAGGEDTKFAQAMLDEGLKIVEDPVITVHHSHGLDPVNYARQTAAWNRMAKGSTEPIDFEALKRRRPDLDFS